MPEDKTSAVKEREEITQAWLAEQKPEEAKPRDPLGRTDMSFYDLPRGWQHQVTRENFALWSLDGEAMKQTLDSGSPVELIDDKLRARRWLDSRVAQGYSTMRKGDDG